MFKFIIVLISILWASLMLISWSGATPVVPSQTAEIHSSTSISS